MSNISINITNDKITLNKSERQNNLIYTYKNV